MAKAKRGIRVIEASGTPYEIGVQYGSAVPEEIRKALNIYYKLLGRERTAAIALARKYISQAQEYVPDAVEMMKGIAEGAKLDFEDIFFLNVGVDLCCAGDVGAFSVGCTSFAASGEATSDGETIVGQSLDWVAAAEEMAVVLKFKPIKGPSVLTVWLVGCMPSYGLNSAGLGIAANGFFYQALVPPTYVGVPTETLFGGKILASENIGKAIGAIATTPRPAPRDMHTDGYMIASREGDIVYVESTWNDFNILYPERGFLVHTNHFVTDRFKSADMIGNIVPDSYIRLGRMTTLMANRHGELSVDVMKEFYQDHNNYSDSICRHGDEKLPPERRGATFATYIAHPKEQKLYVALGNPCKNEFVEYKL